MVAIQEMAVFAEGLESEVLLPITSSLLLTLLNACCCNKNLQAFYQTAVLQSPHFMCIQVPVKRKHLYCTAVAMNSQTDIYSILNITSAHVHLIASGCFLPLAVWNIHEIFK